MWSYPPMLKDKLRKVNNFIVGGVVKKFVIWIVVIIMLLGALTTIFVQITLTTTLSEELQEKGLVLSRTLASSSVEPLLLEDKVNLQRLVEKIKNSEEKIKYVYITDENGKVLVHTFEGGFPKDFLSPRQEAGVSYLIDGDTHIIDFSASILDERAGFVHIGMDETPINEKIAQTSYVIITLTFIVGLMGVIMAYMAGSYLTRPIRALIKGAEEIGRGNLGYQIKVGSTDEIHVLSKAFNQMSYNLNNSISELRTSEERYRKLVNGISDAVILIDSQKRILSWNRAAHKIFGWSFREVVGREINVLYPNSNVSQEISDGEEVFIKKDGNTFPGLVSKKPVQEGGDTSNVVVIRDITEQKEREKLEMQLLQSDRLATIGQLAAGVAHEINNPIGVISLYTQMLLKKTKDGTNKDKLKTIYEEANRTAHIVRGLLEFAHQSDPKLSPMDINAEIEKILSILDHQFKDIRVTPILGPIPLISADTGQIRQVLMNMLTNSIQAITKNGEIVIKTAAKQDQVEIIISDNGCGIPQENLSKIFNPFFTTKKPGEGTGLGLSICYGIIKRHNGSIEVESKVGIGTTFTIKLPAY